MVTGAAMRRAYTLAEARASEEGYAVALDGRIARTPARRALVLPTAALAEAVATEWQAQARVVRPATMPLTRLAAVARDLVAERREAIIDEVAGYAATDLLCHWADEPPELRERQAAAWGPLLDWLAQRYGARLTATAGVLPVSQPEAALGALRRAVAGCDDFALAAVHRLTTASGSLILALAVAEGRLEPAAAWALSRIDEAFQNERWGEDAEAAERAGRVREDFVAAARFLALIKG